MADHPGKLYLGREYDLRTRSVTSEPVLLSTRTLTTHAVCLGMTGTGKTGLGIAVLEEALLQGIPCIIIDPKGDITNLALTFPRLAPDDFRPWLDADEAARQGLSLEQLAIETASKWRAGLQDWGIGTERVARLAERTCFDIYTPGSDAGIPVNVLLSLAPPTEPNITWDWDKSAEVLRERIAQVVQALLSLVGIEADPLTSREHILLATIFEAAWRAGQELSIPLLIRGIQEPPVQRIGAFDMDVFYPRSERFALAMALNNLVASPSFAAWTKGSRLDIGTLIKPKFESGLLRTRAAIFYLAHLGEAERQFFITLLLSQLVMWMRAQSGTSVLRCLVYFDEVFGYVPPFPRNPPTKSPLMTLIKQGRAAGLGVFLATQNPADLDYKSLSNIGTWFIGRLRTSRDRERALEGLEGTGTGFDRAQFEAPLSTLPPRVFLLQSAQGDPRFFHSRWAMSFLRGPLTREQIAMLETDDAEDTPTHSSRSVYSLFSRPELPTEVPEVFLRTSPLHSTSNNKPSHTASKHYVPYLLAVSSVRIADRASGNLHHERYIYLLALNQSPAPIPDFSKAHRLNNLSLEDLETAPANHARFDPLPSGITARWLKQVERALVDYLYHHEVKTIWFNRTLKLYGRIGESRLAFRQRCEAAARQRRDAEAAKLHNQFDRRMKALQDKLAREHNELAADRAELSSRKREELLSGVETLFNLLVGRRPTYAIAFSARRRREVETAAQDVRESEAVIAKLNADLEALAEEYKTALGHLNEKWARALNDIEELPITPKKGNILVERLAIAWVPLS
jgi:hypothetical protein